jgi:hypothetical protein
MSDDETRPIDPEAPVPPTVEPQPPASAAAQPGPQPATQPAYAMPLPAGYPAYAAPQRPRFADQVMGMRAVVAVALACLIIGGLSGFILGHAAGSEGGRSGRLPGSQRIFPNGQNGFPNGSNGFPNQQFGQGQSGP